MKIWFVYVMVLIVSFFLIGFAEADPPKLKWDASTGPVVGYKVYYFDTTTPEIIWSKLTPDLEMPLSELNLHPGNGYQFYVTAYSTEGESGHSNTVDHLEPDFVIENNPKQTVIIVPGDVLIQLVPRD